MSSLLLKCNYSIDLSYYKNLKFFESEKIKSQPCMKLIDCSYAVKQYLLMHKINHVSYYTNECF